MIQGPRFRYVPLPFEHFLYKDMYRVGSYKTPASFLTPNIFNLRTVRAITVT